MPLYTSPYLEVEYSFDRHMFDGVGLDPFPQELLFDGFVALVGRTEQVDLKVLGAL